MTPIENIINTIGEWLLVFTGIYCCFVNHPVLGGVAIGLSCLMGIARYAYFMKKEQSN